MRATSVLLAFFLSILASFSPVHAQQSGLDFGAGERILTFTSDIQIDRDSTLHVVETIRIRAQGNAFRRGILRDFPTRYQRDGRTVRVGFEVLSVERNGEPEDWTTESLDNGTRVRVGAEDRFLEFGVHRYTIRYRTTRQLGFFPDHDELYWNVTGNGWAFPIDVAEARIRLPEPVPFGNRAFYTGPQGSTGSDAKVMEEKPGEIWIRATRGLEPNEGLTIAMAWPKGIVEPPPQPSERDQWLEDHLPLVAAFAAIAGLCLFYFHAWRTAGRGPVPGTIVPLFAPPKDLSAAASRYVRRMGYDSRVFAAAIVGCGVSGNLQLAEEESGFWKGTKTWLKKTGSGHNMHGPEQTMHQALFMGGDELEMDKKHHALFTAAQRQLREGLEKAYRGKTFLTNKSWALAGLLGLPAAMMLVGAALIGTDFYGERIFALVPLLGVGLSLSAIGLGAHSRFAGEERSLLNAVLAVVLAIASCAALIATIVIAAESGTRLWQIVLPLVTLPIIVSAFWWMAAPTPEGRTLMDQIAGFQRYLSATEKHRLEHLHPPRKTPELFERYLPYAIALGVENRWAAQFASVLAGASTDPQQSQMRWYSGNQSPWSNPARFASAMGASLASTAAAASVAPGSSSGSGGGGSSGGGGGGGGGGGW